MSDHKHGKMDISDHEKTFAAFVRVGTTGVALCLLVLIFMALVNA